MQNARSDGKPPCLEDVLELYSRKAFLNIEVKVRGMEQVVAASRETLSSATRLLYLVVSAQRCAQAACSGSRRLVLGAISKSYWHLRRWKALPVSYVVPHYGLLTPKLMDELHAAGKTVVTWTVNDPRKMLQPQRWAWTESSPTTRSCWWRRWEARVMLC